MREMNVGSCHCVKFLPCIFTFRTEIKKHSYKTGSQTDCNDNSSQCDVTSSVPTTFKILYVHDNHMSFVVGTFISKETLHANMSTSFWLHIAGKGWMNCRMSSH